MVVKFANYSRTNHLLKKSIDFEDKINLANFLKFSVANNCSADEKFYEQISKDLKVFHELKSSCLKQKHCKRKQKPITKQMIKRASNLQFTEILSIRNGKMSINKNEWSNEIIKKYGYLLPDIDMVINVLDEPRLLKKKVMKQDVYPAYFNNFTNDYRFKYYSNGTLYKLMNEVCDEKSYSKILLHSMFKNPPTFLAIDDLLPIFSEATIGGCFNDIIFPRYRLFGKIIDFKNDVLPWEADIPEWENKTDIFFWRGSTTGARYDSKNFHNYHRSRLVEFDSNQLLDAKFTRIHTQIRNTDLEMNNPQQDLVKEISKFYESKGLLSNHADFSNFAKYKYIIDIDGNTFSLRFVDLLRYTKSLILKIAVFDDFYTINTQPFVHYLPVKMDLSDLNEKIAWATRNQKKAKKIAQMAQIYFKENLIYKDIWCYFFRLAYEYSEIAETL